MFSSIRVMCRILVVVYVNMYSYCSVLHAYVTGACLNELKDGSYYTAILLLMRKSPKNGNRKHFARTVVTLKNSGTLRFVCEGTIWIRATATGDRGRRHHQLDVWHKHITLCMY